MANLRRHFNFSGKSSQERDMSFSTSPADKFYRHCDKNNLMNDICNCLDLCCEYIQALNSLCGAGSSLARNLFHAVREVPAFQNVSLQFLSVWEEISKATAGASAAVKTETLMMLQEILNSLEMGKSETDTEQTIIESFQVIGTCLSSFIELQAQFSLSTWKSLSKLSKYFTNDSVRHSLQWKSLERAPSKITVNSELNGTIKKHFSQLISKVGVQKINEPNNTSVNQFHSSMHQEMSSIPIYSPFENQSIPGNAEENSLWSPPTSVWNSVDSTSMSFHNQSQSTEQGSPNISSIGSDLDEVINLLSCGPVQQPCHKLNNHNYVPFHPNKEQMYHLLPKASMTPISRSLSSQQSWPKDQREISLGYDKWLWRLDNMNCPELPFNSDILKLQSQKNRDPQGQWECKELHKWHSSVGGICETGSSSDDGSSIHGTDSECFRFGESGVFGKHMNTFSNRKQSSGESMPGGLENISESKEEYLWTTQSKINTWPLKQSALRNCDGECEDKLEYTECPNDYIIS